MLTYLPIIKQTFYTTAIPSEYIAGKTIRNVKLSYRVLKATLYLSSNDYSFVFWIKNETDIDIGFYFGKTFTLQEFAIFRSYLSRHKLWKSH